MSNMTIDVNKVWTIVESYPQLSVELLSTLAANIKTVPAMVAVAKGGFKLTDIVAFMKAHQDVALTLLAQVLKAAEANPELLKEVLSAAVEVAAEAVGAQ